MGGQWPEGPQLLESLGPKVPTFQSPRTGDTTYKPTQQVRSRPLRISLGPWCCGHSKQLSAVTRSKETSHVWLISSPAAFCLLPTHQSCLRRYFAAVLAHSPTPLALTHFPVFFPVFSRYRKPRKYQEGNTLFVLIC